jgi:hypothetical protein
LASTKPPTYTGTPTITCSSSRAGPTRLNRTSTSGGHRNSTGRCNRTPPRKSSRTSWVRMKRANGSRVPMARITSGWPR